jgi:hypothetical protein
MISNNEVIWDLKHFTISFWKTTNKSQFGTWMSEEKYTAGLIRTVTKRPEGFQYGPNPTTSNFFKHDSNLLAVGFNDSSVSIYDINKV